MTNGSSQGLFVIVAVVIFGIFVAISYSIFNGSLQPALANIFNDSLETANDNLLKGKNYIQGFKDNGYYTLTDPLKESIRGYSKYNNIPSFKIDNKNVTYSNYKQVGLYRYIRDLDFKKGDTIVISVFARGKGKLYFGQEGFEKINSVKIVDLSEDFKKYTLSFVADENYADKEAQFKAVIFYTYYETSMEIHSPEYYVIKGGN